MNDAVLESVTCGNTQVDSRNARIVFNRMSKPDTKTGQTSYEEQFTVSIINKKLILLSHQLGVATGNTKTR